MVTAEDTGVVVEVQVEAGVPEDITLVLALIQDPLPVPILGPLLTPVLGPLLAFIPLLDRALHILVLPGKFCLSFPMQSKIVLHHLNCDLLIQKVDISG